MIIENHLIKNDLQEPVEYVATPNKGRTFSPLYLVMHYTGSTSAKSAVNWLTNPAAKASAHLVIDKQGKIYQLAPFNVITWHAGVSAWDGLIGMNAYAIGIELVNSGRLAKSVSRYYCPLDRKAIPEKDVAIATHKNESKESAWESYSAVQIDTALKVGLLLFDQYKLRDVIGHDDVAPHRKSDPGPAFPMSGFRAKLVGRREDTPETYKTTTVLNIRSGPGTGFPIVNAPLEKGSKITLIRTAGTWGLVNTEDSDIEGWVSLKYVKR